MRPQWLPATLAVALLLTFAPLAGADADSLSPSVEMPSDSAEWLPALVSPQPLQCVLPVQQVANAEAEPCPPGPNNLAAVQGGRFHVYACLRTQSEAEQRPANIFLVTRQSGLFWFFDPDNVEVVVKVIDACIEPFNRFWFFAAGLTNVEVTLTVIDQFTEETKTYQSPLGMPFQPILDTNAFDTCP